MNRRFVSLAGRFTKVSGPQIIGEIALRIMPNNQSIVISRLAMVAAFSVFVCQSRAGLQEGVAAYQAGDVALAVKEFRAAAEKGDANCQYNLAMMYEQGIGLGKDEKEAVVWYRKAAEQGNSNAQFNLGVLYENGRGTPVDFAQANQWYRKAAAQGDPLAIGNLGMLYVRGDGVKVDKVAGVALLLQSAAMDPSPTNFAKQNLAKTKGITPEIVAAAQALVAEFASEKDLLKPLDRHLKPAAVKTAEPVK